MTLDLLRPCLDCGEPTGASRCPAHTRTRAANRPRQSFRQRGYDGAWDRLSRKARKLQPFCTDCGATAPLALDHKPEAWHAKANGKRITLQMVEVVCAPCNARRGESRPGSKRYAEWEASRG